MKHSEKIPNTERIMTNDMTTYLPLPDREMFEREIHDLFQNGDISHIARYMQRDQAQVSKMLNPYDETRHNPVYEFLRMLWAMDCKRDGLADAVLSIVTREREKWLVGSLDVVEAPAKLTGRIGKEFAQAVEVELSDAPIDEQIKEFTDARNALDDKLESLIHIRRSQFVPRQWAREAVANGNGGKR